MSQPDDESNESTLLESPANPREKAMGFFDHLEDLRWTIIKCLVTFVIFAGSIAFFLREFNDVVLWPLRHVQSQKPSLVLELGTTAIMEGFTVVVQLCAVGGIALSAPFCLFFLGQFISPALTEKELKLVLPGVLTGMLLFIIGASFSFFLLIPSTISFSAQLNEFFGFVTRWTPASYYSLFLWMIGGVGLAFEFPLLIVLLVYLGILDAATLRKYRRHAVVAILIIAAIATPTPDPFTQLMFAAPLYVLFEISILVSVQVEKRRRV